VGVPVFTAGSLLAVGLRATVREAFAPLADARFVALTLLVGWVVCPGVARILLAMVPLDRPYAAGLLVLSLAPAAPFAPALMQRARADSGHTAAFMILATVATVAILPFAAPALIGGVATPPMVIAKPLVLFVMVPLLIGVAARWLNPGLADRALQPVTLITNAAGLVLLVAIVPLYGPGMVNAVGSFAIAMQIVFVALVTLLAHAAGAGLSDSAQTVLTLGMCSRNLGAALAPLAEIEPDPRAMVMIAIAAPVTLACSIAAARWLAPRRAGFA
jgi:BASS family bile acid:Na+ symporter